MQLRYRITPWLIASSALHAPLDQIADDALHQLGPYWKSEALCSGHQLHVRSDFSGCREVGLLTKGEFEWLPDMLCGTQVTATNVDIASVAPTYHLYTKEEIEEVVSRL